MLSVMESPFSRVGEERPRPLLSPHWRPLPCFNVKIIDWNMKQAFSFAFRTPPEPPDLVPQPISHKNIELTPSTNHGGRQHPILKPKKRSATGVFARFRNTLPLLILPHWRPPVDCSSANITIWKNLFSFSGYVFKTLKRQSPKSVLIINSLTI